MSLSPFDDYPIHQIADVVRHVGTSDRNFYDRYYFGCHGGRADLPYLITGLGVYPNLVSPTPLHRCAMATTSWCSGPLVRWATTAPI